MKPSKQIIEFLYYPQQRHKPSLQDTFKLMLQIDEVKSENIETWKKTEIVWQNGDVEIFGEYYEVENAEGTAILSHGYGQNRCILLPQQVIFRKLGFNTIIFDQRAFGMSKAEICTFGLKESEDIAIIVQWAKKQLNKNLKIVVLGVSMGAAAAINSLQYTDDIDFLIADSSFAVMLNELCGLCGNEYSSDIESVTYFV